MLLQDLNTTMSVIQIHIQIYFILVKLTRSKTKQALNVVYFDQQMGASHGVCWSKSSFLCLKHFFSSFSVTNRIKDEKAQKSTRKKGNDTALCYS